MDLAASFTDLGYQFHSQEPDIDTTATHDDQLNALNGLINAWEQRYEPPNLKWQNDPVLWAKERLGINLWSKQQIIIESVRDNRLTTVHSCHAVGKSLVSTVIALWWIDTHQVGDAFVVTTAPTHPQVQAILWREMNRWHKRGNLDGRMNLTEWYFGNEIVAFGRKPADYDPAAFQGIHAVYVLVIFDEACGIPKPLWDAASTLVVNEESRFLAVGNPDDPHGEFSKVCKPGSGWNTIHVSADMTPNFTGEEVDEVVSKSLVSPGWVEEKRKSWGENSALFASKVKGIFPTDSESGVVPHSWAAACKYLQLPADGRRCAGLDVGGGGDRTVLRERIGPKAGREEIWLESDPMVAVGQIVTKLIEWDIERVVVDTIGIGWGIYGRIKELSRRHNHSSDAIHDAEVIAFNAAQAPKDPKEQKRFINKRAELHWNVGRELSRLKAWDLEAVDDDTIAELTEAQYEIMDSRGKIKVEAKDKIIERLGSSPDRADALLMAFWEGDSAEAHLPAANILTLSAYDRVYEPNGPHWAGPIKQQVAEDGVDRASEADLMRELMLGRPL